MPIPLTPTEIKLAREFRRQGASWERTAKAVGRKTDFVRKSLDLEFRETRSLYSADYVRRLRLSRSSGAIGVGPACPKPHRGALWRSKAGTKCIGQTQAEIGGRE